MSASGYKRATKKYATRVDHVDGDVSTGFVLVPVGSDFLTTIAQTDGFLNFEMESGEETYLSMSGIKRITPVVDPAARQREKEEKERQAAAEKAQTEARLAEERERARARAAERAKSGKRKSPYSRKEEYEALDTLGVGDHATHDELHGTYRRLVKLYHPDRLRGMGVSDKKIAYAAERLAEINNAYRILSKAMKAA